MKAKRKVGRPLEGDALKTKMLSFKITDEENTRLRTAAHKLELSISKFIYKCVFRQVNKTLKE